MNAPRPLVTAALVLTSCLVGCAEADSIDGPDMDAPELHTLEGPSGGTNSCSSIWFHALDDELLLATTSPLVSPGTTDVHPQIVTDLLEKPQGTDVFSYAVKCALSREPGQNTVTWQKSAADTFVFTGKEHLDTTAGWLTGALTDADRGDLFACMLGLLNPWGLEVDVLFTGPNVHDDGLPHPDFDFEEALWLAEVDSATGRVMYTVWPLFDLAENCMGDVGEILKLRICGPNPLSCHLTIGNTTDCVYSSSPEGYYCKGKPALMTTLRSTDVLALHPTCGFTGTP